MKTFRILMILLVAAFSFALLTSCSSENDPDPSETSDLLVKSEEMSEIKFYEKDGRVFPARIDNERSLIVVHRDNIDALSEKLYKAGIKTCKYMFQYGALGFRTKFEGTEEIFNDWFFTTIRTDVETSYSFPEVISAINFVNYYPYGHTQRFTHNIAMISPKSTSLDEIKKFAERNRAIVLGYTLDDRGVAIMCTRESEYNALGFLEKAVEEEVARSTGNYLLMDDNVRTCYYEPRTEYLDGDGSDEELDGKFTIIERRE